MFKCSRYKISGELLHLHCFSSFLARDYFCRLLKISDNLCKQFGPRSGPTKRRSWSGSKLFDALMVFLKEIFEKDNYEKSADDNKSMKNYPAWYKLINLTLILFPAEEIYMLYSLVFQIYFSCMIQVAWKIVWIHGPRTSDSLLINLPKFWQPVARIMHIWQQ